MLQGQISFLAVFDHALDLAPDRNVSSEQGQANVGADAEVRALVVNHQRFILRVGFEQFQCVFVGRERQRIKRVHF